MFRVGWGKQNGKGGHSAWVELKHEAEQMAIRMDRMFNDSYHWVEEKTDTVVSKNGT